MSRPHIRPATSARLARLALAARTSRQARLAALVAGTSLVTAACGIGNASVNPTALGAPAGTPIRVGISLPLTGSFSADGQACLRGYQLWASDVNSHGGLLHRPVRLVIRNDNSDPNKAKADYRVLIGPDHVDLTLAPFSSLLTVAAAPVTDQYGYALVAGSAGAPAVYQLGLNSLFSTNVPASSQMVPFAHWVLSLQGSARPTSAAYPMIDDPFADPPVEHAQQILAAGGVKTLLYSPKHLYSPTSSQAQLMSDAKAVAATHAQMVVLGSVDVPTVSAFIHEFIKLGYNPKIFIAAAGPDQGQSFLAKVGVGNSVGIMVPNGWYGAFPNALSHVMVQSYIAKYGDTASDINADVAESYSAGEVMAAAVTATGELSQPQIIAWLHGHEIQTVLGAVKFSGNGQNLDATSAALIFQWQPGARFVQVLPRALPGSVPIIATKPTWSG